MLIDTIRFGQVEIDEGKILHFSEGLPGLEEYNKFAILQFEESYPIVWLQSVVDGEVCLPVIDSFLAVSEYAFNLGDEDVKELKLEGPEDLHILSVLVIPDNIEQMTVNMAAPIIINMRTGEARQIILSGGEYNVRHPIFQEICSLIKEGEADAGSVEEDK